MIEHVRGELQVSERRACVALGQHRSTQRKAPQTAGRLTRSDAMTISIAQVRTMLQALGAMSRVRLFSQGSERDFADFGDLGCELCLNLSALATFRELVAADVLIMSKSSFSYVAAILNDGVQIYDRYARSPMTDWVERGRDGLADPTLLRSKLETHVAARAQYT